MSWVRRVTEPSVKRVRPSPSLDRRLVERFWANSRGYPDSDPFERFLALARKMGFRCLVVEDALGRVDVAAELDGLGRPDGTDGWVSAAALTFLSTPVQGERPLRIDEASLIGQATVLTFPDVDGPRSFIYEAVFRLPAERPNGSHESRLPLVLPLKVTVASRIYTLEGAFYSQRDDLDRNRVDGALETAMRALTGEAAEPCARLAAAEARGAALPPSRAIAKELAAYGYNVVGYNLEAGKRSSNAVRVRHTWSTILSLLESHIPVLLVIGDGDGEVVLPVLGYTVDPDAWRPEAAVYGRGTGSEALSVSRWMDNLIVQDPRLGPGLSLSRSWLSDAAGKGSAGSPAPRYVIATMPQGVRMSPVVAEGVAGAALSNWTRTLAELGMGRGSWWRHLLRNGSNVLLRTTLVSGEDYRYHMEALFRSKPGRTADVVKEGYLTGLPEKAWLCELSLPHLFLGRRHKLGEMILDASLPDRQATLDSVVRFRLPSLLGWIEGENSFAIAQTGIRDPVGIRAPAEGPSHPARGGPVP